MSMLNTSSARSRSGPRPRPTGWLHVLLSVCLLILCPVSAFLTIVLVGGYQIALPYAALCLLQLVMLVPLLVGGLGWLRPTRTSRPRDAFPPLCFLVGTVLTLGVTLLRAWDDGIRGSALPRLRFGVRHDVPLEVDVLYLAAIGLAALSLLMAVATALLLALHSAPVRRLRGRAAEESTETT
ncbi:hypothetical protein BH708_10960 [Brachybacterium sp. P6-10-X1]|uniref:hypothetical protein n=1 Tax=Brachybacterium sp. P6-10-X1 TaxID=1903186 RepID=UPI000971BA0B|nr:hypothetical protein [Brachybacterium sp. P6-10-X1]APX33144.1 hypothetical protein BH708_10960 [Brachybacterium sp. P6-10-X1]